MLRKHRDKQQCAVLLGSQHARYTTSRLVVQAAVAFTHFARKPAVVVRTALKEAWPGGPTFSGTAQVSQLRRPTRIFSEPDDESCHLASVEARIPFLYHPGRRTGLPCSQADTLQGCARLT